MSRHKRTTLPLPVSGVSAGLSAFEQMGVDKVLTSGGETSVGEQETHKAKRFLARRKRRCSKRRRSLAPPSTGSEPSWLYGQRSSTVWKTKPVYLMPWVRPGSLVRWPQSPLGESAYCRESSDHSDIEKGVKTKRTLRDESMILSRVFRCDGETVVSVWSRRSAFSNWRVEKIVGA